MLPQINVDSDYPSPYEDPQFWIDKILEDLFWFARVVLSYGKRREYKDLNWVHLRLCDFMDRFKTPALQKLILMSRDCFKSTLARALILQEMLRALYTKTDLKIGIYAGLYELGEDHLDRIINEIFHNELLKAFFHMYLPRKKSDADTMTKEKIRYKGVEIDIGSPERSLTGHHYDMIINDNLCNELNTATSEQRKKVITRWQQQESVIAENAYEYIFETTWETDDLSGVILDPDGKFNYRLIYRRPAYTFVSSTGYSVFSCPARDQNGDPVFPAKCNEHYLSRKRAKQGAYIYSRMYELQPIPSDEFLFQGRWIRHYEELPKNFIRNIAIDAAGSTRKDSSYSAVTINDWDSEGKMHISYAKKLKVTPIQLRDWILKLEQKCIAEERPITFCLIEKEKFGISLASIMEETKTGMYITPIELRNVPRPKRLHSLVPYFESGRIQMAKGLTDFEDEIRTYHLDKVKGTDLLDSLFLHTQMEYRPKNIPLPDMLEVDDDDFAKQLRKERGQIKNTPMRKFVNRHF